MNKAAFARYHAINRFLRTHEYATVWDLKDQCEEVLGYSLSERQIYRDIHNMRYDSRLGYHAPIKTRRTGGNVYYTYSDLSYSIDKLPLSTDELNALIFAAGMLDQMKGIPLLENLNDAINKIAYHLRIRKHLTEEEVNDFIDIETAVEVKGIEYLNPLINAIKEKKVIRLRYRAFQKDRAFTHTFHPYLLKEYRNRWYVFGYNQYWKGLRIYAFDRIEKIETDHSEKYRVSKKPPKYYFRNLIGVTRFKGTDPAQIVLKFSNQQASYVLTQPLHESQQVLEQTDEHLIISLMVHPSPELQITLLGWNKEVEVLEPEDFRNEIKGMIKGALGNY
jgi:predicted DNA-binding transcriptional regulator YafY